MGIFLERLILEDFRNFKGRTEIEFTSPLTAIVGKNSTGKSSILSSIEYLASGKENEVEEIGRIEGVVNGRKILYPEETLRSAGVILLKLRSTRGVSESIRVDYPDRSSPDFVRLVQGFDLGKDSLERLNETCCRNLGFELCREGKDLLAVFEYGHKVPVNKLSAGLQSLLALETIFLITLKNPDRKYLILLEEVENFLHPTQLRALIEKLKEASCEDRYQIILTTHSPLVVSMLTPGNIIRISAEGAVHQLKKTTRKMVETWIKLLDPIKSEVFFADKVIVYEGITDQFIIEGALKSTGVDLNRKDVVSIKLDGLYHYESITDILRSFQIPYLAIVDRDPGGRTQEELKGKFITMLNPYGEIEDAIPLEDWIRILENNERDAEIWFLINLLDYYLGREDSFERFGDAIARSFGKNKLSYAYRLGKLYEKSTGVGIRDKGVGTFVSVVEDFLAGRDISIELKKVDKDIRSKNVLLLDESLGLSKEKIVNFLYEEDLFPDEILPFMVNGRHYGLVTRRAIPVMLEARVPFVAVLGRDYDINRAYRTLSNVEKTDVEYKDDRTLKISIEGINSFITVRQRLSEEDLGKLADFNV